MLNQQTSKTQTILDMILALSWQEQLQIIMTLLHSWSHIIPVETQTEPFSQIDDVGFKKDTKINFVETSKADFFPEDESVDDFLAFLVEQRKENLVS